VKGMHGRWVVLALLAILAAGAAGAQEQEGGFEQVLEISRTSCLMCHAWADSHEGLSDPVRTVPGDPESSPLYLKVRSDEMPMAGPKLTEEQKGVIHEWIRRGARQAAAGAGNGGGAAVLPAGKPPDNGALPGPTGSPGAEAAASSSRFLGFRSKVSFHQVSGFTSASLLLAAGIVGAVQWGTFIAEGHELRQQLGLDEEDQIGADCINKIEEMWESPLHQGLRWTHVGLLSAGNALYLANAVTGTTMISREDPGLSASDLHRYAFFAHGALMIAQVIMGVLTTEVLSTGSHELITAYGIAHTAIGLTIPILMISAGIAVNRGFPRKG